MLYKLVVAICGILTTLTLASIIENYTLNSIKKIFGYCGAMSLGIYVFQFQFLGIKPYFFAPLLLSLIASYVVLQIPILKLLILGATNYPKK